MSMSGASILTVKAGSVLMKAPVSPISAREDTTPTLSSRLANGSSTATFNAASDMSRLDSRTTLSCLEVVAWLAMTWAIPAAGLAGELLPLKTIARATPAINPKAPRPAAMQTLVLGELLVAEAVLVVSGAPLMVRYPEREPGLAASRAAGGCARTPLPGYSAALRRPDSTAGSAAAPDRQCRRATSPQHRAPA